MRDSVQPHERREVLIQGDEDAVLASRHFQEGKVARIGTEAL